MCVLVVARKKFPTLEQLEKMERKNPDGGGIGWMEGGVAHWRKGLTAKQIFDIGGQLPLPVVIHFRMATVGGTKKELCHPFPVTPKAGLQLRGSAKSVLFHNGHWSDYADLLAVARAKGRLPKADKAFLSDTRAMAMLVSTYGEGLLEVLGLSHQKLVVLTGTGVERYGKFEDWQDLEVSNTHFDYTYCPAPPRVYGGSNGAPYGSYSEYGYWHQGQWVEYADEAHWGQRPPRRISTYPSVTKKEPEPAPVNNNPDGKCLFCAKIWVMDLATKATYCPDCSVPLMTLDLAAVVEQGGEMYQAKLPTQPELIGGGLGPIIEMPGGVKMQYSEAIGDYVELVDNLTPDSLVSVTGE